MKKLTIGATLLFGLILSSCSTFKNVDIVKRRYNGGYHIAVRDQKTKTEPVAAKTDKPETIAVADQKPEEPATVVNQEPQNPVGVQTAPVAANEKTAASGNHKTQSAPAFASVNKERTEPRHKLRSPVVRSKTWSSSGSSASDTELIILVILAILLPPVAVYLVEETSSRFWITLILCLLSCVGFLFVFGFGLWFVAIIIALLAVLK